MRNSATRLILSALFFLGALTADFSAQTALPESPSVIEAVLVQGGTFLMGSNEGDPDEKPIHEVSLPDFYIGKYEVTQELYESIMASNPSVLKGDMKRPVENVSWYDAVLFCNKISVMERLDPAYAVSGKNVVLTEGANGWRLPTEAEWEFAARGGNEGLERKYRYSGSNDLGAVAWYSGNSGSTTHPVGLKAPNTLGIYDMSGNVWEWCNDFYGAYSIERQENPLGPASGAGNVYRGGCWYNGLIYCSPSDRYTGSAFYRHYDLGFRVARSR